MVPALRFEEYAGERRLLKLSLIERVEDIDARLFGRSGGCGFVRLDGRLVPVANGHHAFSEEKVAALRLRDGAREACYPVAAVLDIVEMPAVPDMVAMHGQIGRASCRERVRQYVYITVGAVLLKQKKQQK